MKMTNDKMIIHAVKEMTKEIEALRKENMTLKKELDKQTLPVPIDINSFGINIGEDVNDKLKAFINAKEKIGLYSNTSYLTGNIIVEKPNLEKEIDELKNEISVLSKIVNRDAALKLELKSIVCDVKRIKSLEDADRAMKRLYELFDKIK